MWIRRLHYHFVLSWQLARWCSWNSPVSCYPWRPEIRILVCFLRVLLLSTLLLISAALAHAQLRVEWKDERLSVSAVKVPLAQILQEISCQTGMEIRGLEGYKEPFSVHFTDLPLHEGLLKFTANYLIVWKTFPLQAQRPVLALVSGPRVLLSGQPLPGQTIRNVEGPEHTEEAGAEDEQSKRIEALRVLAGQGDEEALRKALLDPDSTIQATALTLLAEWDHQRVTPLLLDETKSDKPERRLQALQLLYQTDPADGGEIQSALRQALNDEDSSVKGYAIQALADQGGANALAYLRQAFNDPDPAIRMFVIEQAALREHTLPLLHEALSDTDEEVHSLASSFLAGE